MEGTHSYFVGHLGQGICVHNDCSGASTWEWVTRKAPGGDGGVSRIGMERLAGETISVVHQVDANGTIVHQHQTHIGRYGGERLLPEEWIEYKSCGAK